MLYLRTAFLFLLLFFGLLWPSAWAQTPNETGPAETHHYAIDIAGIRVGTMTVVRQPQANNRTLHTVISEVKVNLLVYTVKVYYKVTNQFDGEKLMLSTVDVRTNRGNFLSRTEWQGNQYEINADQYKYSRKGAENQIIDFPSSLLYFKEPVGRSKVYAEYFGDYFTMTPTAAGTYQASIADRRDEYIYKNGRLVRVIKHNSIKNFVIRLLD